MGALDRPLEFSARTGEPIVVRSVTLDDAAAVLDFLRATAATTDQILSYPDEFPATVEEERAKLAAMIDDPGALMIVAHHKDTTVGCASIGAHARRRMAHTASLGLSAAAAWRGRGVGTILMQVLLDWARAQPRIEKACLSVWETNAVGRRLYERLGFAYEGRRTGQCRQADGTYVDELFMGLWLKPRRTA